MSRNKSQWTTAPEGRRFVPLCWEMEEQAPFMGISLLQQRDELADGTADELQVSLGYQGNLSNGI